MFVKTNLTEQSHPNYTRRETMLKNALISTWTLLMMGLFPLTIYGSPSVPVGARQMGMGETFTGIADDGIAIFYNPAGLSRIERYGVELMRAQLYDLGGLFFKELDEGQNSVSIVLPLAKNFAAGFGYEQLGIVDDAVDFSQQRFTIPLSLTRDDISVGLNLKTFQMKTHLDGFKVGDSSTSLGIDTGLLIQSTFLPTPLKNRLQLGVMASDLFGGTVTHNTGTEEKIFPTTYRIGLMYDLIKKEQQQWLVAFDVDENRLHFGSEYSPHPFFAFRGGMQLDLHTDEAPTFSLGATTKYESEGFEMFLHGAYVHHPMLPGSVYASVAFNLPQRSPIKIEAIQFVEIYPALLHFYAKEHIQQLVVFPRENPFELPEVTDILAFEGQVQFQRRGDETWHKVDRRIKLQAGDKVHLIDANATIKVQQGNLKVLYVNQEIEPQLTEEDTIGRIWLENRTDQPLQLRVFVEVLDTAKEHPVTDFVMLPPKAKVSVPLRQIIFHPSILERTETIRSNQAQLRLVSFHPDTIKEVHENQEIQSFTTFSRNDLVWNDVQTIGAFINPQDKTIRDFSTTILKHYDEEINKTSINRNLYQAMLIFNALRVYGIRISRDSNHWKFRQDQIRFPHEMLKEGVQKGVGDCDDSVTLFSNCLEAIGINTTAVIELPNHVLMAFNTGIPMADIPFEIHGWFEAISCEGSFEGKPTGWIPVETTLIEAGFDVAWKEAVALLGELAVAGCLGNLPAGECSSR
jgi:hypothetical protein